MSNPISPASREEERITRMRVWKERYDRAIQDIADGHEQRTAHSSERRQFPRITLPAGSMVFVHGDEVPYEIHDFSAGGLSFFSHVRMAPGKPVALNVKGILSLQVIVVGCELEEENADLMEYRYRVRAEFTPDVDGCQAFVLANRIFGCADDKAPDSETPEAAAKESA